MTTTLSRRETLEDLLERVRGAKGPNYALEVDIAEAFVWPGRPEFTASIDAALRLVERALPGANTVGFERCPLGCEAYVSHNYAEGDHWMHEGRAATPALALLCALLTALIAQETRG